jgi:hypothetical protein
MMGPLGGVARGPGALTINAKNVNGGTPGRQCRRSRSAHHQCRKMSAAGPREAVPEVRERPPSTQKMSMVGPPRRRCRGSGSAHHQHKEHRWRPPSKIVLEVRQHPPSTQKTSMAGPLGDGARGPRAATINVKNINGGPPRRRYRRSRSAHRQCKKCR